MAIISERFVTAGNRNWLSSVHGISNAPTFKCDVVGKVTAGTVRNDTVIPSGSPVIVHADGTATVVAPKGAVPAFAAGDQLGFTVSDRVADLDEDGTPFLNAATLMHGRIRYSYLSDEAKAAVDAVVAPAEGASSAAFQFTIHRQ